MNATQVFEDADKLATAGQIGNLLKLGSTLSACRDSVKGMTAAVILLAKPKLIGKARKAQYPDISDSTYTNARQACKSISFDSLAGDWRAFRRAYTQRIAERQAEKRTKQAKRDAAEVSEVTQPAMRSALELALEFVRRCVAEGLQPERVLADALKGSTEEMAKAA